MLAWLTFIVSQAAISQRNIDCKLSISGSLKIDVCETDNLKTIILAVDIGQIYFADSLFGFNYELLYDTGKVVFQNVLYINTLAETMELKAFTNNSKLGKINGYAMTNSLVPIAGNKPLIAFAFAWKNTCSDSAEFRIPFIEFTEEFRVNISRYIPIMIYGEVFDYENRTFILSFPENYINTKTADITTDIYLNVPKNSQLTEFDLYLNTQHLSIDSVYSVTGNILPTEIIRVDSGYKIRLKNLNVNEENSKLTMIASLDTSENLKDFVVQAIPKIDFRCKCISKVKTDSLKVEFLKDTISGIEEVKNIDFEKVKGAILVNVLGQTIEIEKESLKDIILRGYIAESELGVYFLLINTGDSLKKIKMINIINNRSH